MLERSDLPLTGLLESFNLYWTISPPVLELHLSLTNNVHNNILMAFIGLKALIREITPCRNC